MLRQLVVVFYRWQQLKTNISLSTAARERNRQSTATFLLLVMFTCWSILLLQARAADQGSGSSVIQKSTLCFAARQEFHCIGPNKWNSKNNLLPTYLQPQHQRNKYCIKLQELQPKTHVYTLYIMYTLYRCIHVYLQMYIMYTSCIHYTTYDGSCRWFSKYRHCNIKNNGY